MTVRALGELDIWTDAERNFINEGLDEFEEGFPKMRLLHLYDIVRATADTLDATKEKGKSATLTLKSLEFRNRSTDIARLLDDSVKSIPSWRKLQGKIGRIERLNPFDNQAAGELPYS